MKASSKQLKTSVAALLSRHGIMPTRQRVEVASVLLAKHQHLTADQVLAQVHARAQNSSQGISKATVYNTLGLLAQKGLINELIVTPGRTVYDSNLSPHYHLYNVDTGRLTDFTTTTIAIDATPHLPQGTVAIGVDVIIRIRNQDSDD